jgi:hypothetical protein
MGYTTIEGLPVAGPPELGDLFVIQQGPTTKEIDVIDYLSQGLPALDPVTTLDIKSYVPTPSISKGITPIIKSLDFISQGIGGLKTSSTVDNTKLIPLVTPGTPPITNILTVKDFLSKGIPLLDTTTQVNSTDLIPLTDAGTKLTKNITTLDFLSQGIPELTTTTATVADTDTLPLTQAANSNKAENINAVNFASQVLPLLTTTNIVNNTTNSLPLVDNNLKTTSDITVQNFLSKSIPQLLTANPILSTHLIPISQTTTTQNTTIDKLNTYVHTHAPQIDQCFYVGTYGVDADDFPERGKNEQLPYASIKYAAMKIAKAKLNDPYNKQYTIFVKTGVYTEDNPIYLPPNTSVIGDNLRRCVVIPLHLTYDIFWVDSGCYIWGFTFGNHIVNHLHPSAAVAFPRNAYNAQLSDQLRTAADNLSSFNIAFNSNYTYGMILSARPLISLSPYTQGCTSYANSSDMNDITINDAGCGMRVDGSLVDGPIRSMVTDSFTQVNQGGYGLHILNHGYASLVSTFTICTTQGVKCENGGTCSISTSNSTFGLSGLVATGMSLYPILTGRIPSNGGFTYLDNYLIVGNINSTPYVDYSVIPETTQIDKSIDNFINIIQDLNNVQKTTPGGSITDSSYLNASKSILRFKPQLQQQVVDYAVALDQAQNPDPANQVFANSPTLTAYCYRDTGYIIDAIAADVANNTNHRSIEVGNMYYKGVTLNVPNYIPNYKYGDLVIPSDEKKLTIDAITSLGKYITGPVSPSIPSFTNVGVLSSIQTGSARSIDVKNLITFINNIINTGTIPAYSPIGTVFPNRNPSSKSNYVADVITNNKTTIQNSVSSFVFRQGFLNVSNPLSAARFATVCNRDIGLILDAITWEIRTGVTARSIEYALAYWNGSISRLGNNLVPNHIQKTITTFNFLRNTIKDILNKNNNPLTGLPFINAAKAPIIASYPYAGCAFTIGDEDGSTPLYVSDYISTQVYPDPGAIKNWFITSTPKTIDNNTCSITLQENLPVNLSNVNGKNYNGAIVKFYQRSQAATGSHTFEYIGTGTRILSSIPSRGGVAHNENEVVYDGLNDPNMPGVVYYTSTNELGNFNVGPQFRIVQSTGTIVGDTFNRSMLTLVTPLNIALE